MSYYDIDPRDIDPDTGRPYSNYSSPSLDTSFHDNEMAVDQSPEERMVEEIEALSPSLGEWAREQLGYGATCAELVAKLREAAAKVGRS